ncbi:MAG: hypothetical protein SVZ03_02270 [Spirochaetota bacterium]|nr:hypothetical protein [Spirochaetota bacterium]
MNKDTERDYKIGEFMIENGIITKKDLDEAVKLQKDNSQRLIGEILVTQGVISKEELVMALQLFYVDTDSNPQHVDEWLDQDEIDMLLERMQSGKKLEHKNQEQ